MKVVMENEDNEVLDNIDFQQEKIDEMWKEIEIVNGRECCPLCGEPLSSSQLVYKLPDNTLAHTKCVLDYVDTESVEYGDVLDDRRNRKSTEEIF